MTNRIIHRAKAILEGKKILILGFGREGRSTYQFLRKIFPEQLLLMADKNSKAFRGIEDNNISIFTGDNYLKAIHRADVVMKSPGISFKTLDNIGKVVISSQADLFIQLFSNQIIGVTGTKGKSTVVSLLYHIYSALNKEVKLVGNIGIPALDIVENITSNTKIIYELSSHQLEFVRFSPHIALLLNLYEEHLDHYQSYNAYRMAKWQIATHQNPNDFFIANLDDAMTQIDFPNLTINSGGFSVSIDGNTKADFYFKNQEIYHQGIGLGFDKGRYKLKGQHNIYNLMVSLAAAFSDGVSLKDALELSYDFIGLPHRLEYVGNHKGVDFFNDSIATIPQATINALFSIDNVETLILGGFDRGIDYSLLVDFLISYKSLDIILLGEVGKRLKSYLEAGKYQGKLHSFKCFDDAVRYAIRTTNKGKSCLLSPAAASYDKFKNFEERGNRFKKLVLGT